MYKFSVVLFLFFVSVSTLDAQDRLFELSVRGSGLANVKQHDKGYSGIGINTEFLYFIKPKIGVGIFYSRSLDTFGNSYFNEDVDGNFEFQMYGVAAQATTNRSRHVRVYATLRFFKAALVHHYPTYNFSIGESGFGYSGGIGLTFRFSDTFGFNLFEVNYVGLSNNFEYTKTLNNGKSPAGFQIQSGLVFKIRKRK